MESQKGAIFLKSLKVPSVEMGTRDFCLFPINYKSYNMLLSRKGRKESHDHSWNLLFVFFSWQSYDLANIHSISSNKLPCSPNQPGVNELPIRYAAYSFSWLRLGPVIVKPVLI